MEFCELKKLIEDFHIQLCIIDLLSKRNAPKDCNVGMARDIGGKAACSYLRDDGFLVMTDADTVPVVWYLETASRYLRSHSSVAALSGSVSVDVPADEESGEIFDLHCVVLHLNELIREAVLVYDCGIPEIRKFPHLAGSNAVVRKKVFVEAGGIPHINGAEDTELSRRILRMGLEIRELGERIGVVTSARHSLHPDPGHGMGPSLMRAFENSEAPWDMPVPSLEAAMLSQIILEVISFINKQTQEKPVEWKSGMHFLVGKYLDSSGCFAFHDDDLKELWEANSVDPTLEDTHFNRILVKVADPIAARVYGFDSLKCVLEDFIGRMREWEEMRFDTLRVREAVLLPGNHDSTRYLEACEAQLRYFNDVLEVRKFRITFQIHIGIYRRLKSELLALPGENVKDLLNITESLFEKCTAALDINLHLSGNHPDHLREGNGIASEEEKSRRRKIFDMSRRSARYMKHRIYYDLKALFKGLLKDKDRFLSAIEDSTEARRILEIIINHQAQLSRADFH